MFFCFRYDQNTLNILEELGCHSSFNTVRDMTCIKNSNKYELQRFDTVDLYPIKEIK